MTKQTRPANCREQPVFPAQLCFRIITISDAVIHSSDALISPQQHGVRIKGNKLACSTSEVMRKYNVLICWGLFYDKKQTKKTKQKEDDFKAVSICFVREQQLFYEKKRRKKKIHILKK